MTAVDARSQYGYEEPSTEAMGAFAAGTTYEDLGSEVVDAVKIRLIDSIGCAVGSIGAEPVRAVRRFVDAYGAGGQCTLIGGGRAAPDRAAFYNSALVRYLDFNDAYAAKRGGGGHPSDNIGAVLAAAELVDASGRNLLTATAVAYHVQVRLTGAASNTRVKYDHTTAGAYSAAAGVGCALGLDDAATGATIAMMGAAHNALYATRTGAISHWKGLAFPHVCGNAVNLGLLAREGVTGPPRVIEGTGGLIQTFTEPFHIDWRREKPNGVTLTNIKKYNAQVHSQTPIEGVIELCAREQVDPSQITAIDLEIFQNAYDSVGGGASGPKWDVTTKEQGDHSLPYMLAAAAIDGEVTPRQYEQDRILRDDVQQLLRKVTVRPNDDFTARFPDEHACRVVISLADGREVSIEKTDYEGQLSNPMGWESVVAKARSLWGARDETLFKEICDAVASLEQVSTRELAGLLERV